VVKTGDVVKVRVKDVDVARKRIALTMKSGAIDLSGARSSGPAPRLRSSAPAPHQSTAAPLESALAAALRRAQEKNSG